MREPSYLRLRRVFSFLLLGSLCGLMGQIGWVAEGREASSVPLEVRYDAERRAVVYRLGADARVTIRAGIDGGPLLKNIIAGAIRPAGERTEPWDGMDESGVVDVVGQKGFLLQAEAVRSEEAGAATAEVPTQLRIGFSGVTQDSTQRLPLVSGSTEMEVSEWGKTAAKENRREYEIVFFVNFQFLGELEGETLPARLPWDTSGVENGEYVVTVNLVGPGGEVSAASARVLVKNRQ